MRVTPVILIALGIWGLISPEALFSLDETSGRILAIIVMLLGIFTLWRFLKHKH